MSKVPVQKGKIDPAIPTMKTQLRKDVNSEDGKHDRERRDGQILKFHTPKTK